MVKLNKKQRKLISAVIEYALVTGFTDYTINDDLSDEKLEEETKNKLIKILEKIESGDKVCL